jgi:alpha-2-macroglobulin-like protein
MSFKSKLSRYFLLPLAAVSIGWGALSALNQEEPNKISNHPFMRQLQEQLDTYTAKLASEKTYIQFDKLFYKPGETIWFAAYVRDAKDLQAAASRVVYVELINPKGTVEKTITLLAQYGQAAGEFELDPSVKGGMYKIKAYTKWQKNTETLFERDVMVQAVVLPNLNMKLDFERKGYGEGEEVVAFVDLANLDKTLLSNYDFEYVVSIDGEKVATEKAKTDKNGRAYIRYKLPKRLSSNDGLLNVMLQYKGQTESISRSIPITLGDIDLQFFAEGGELAAGTASTVAFKALDEFGKPTDIEGNIIDKKGNVISTFKTYHQGMGVVTLTPAADEIYTAQITSPVSLKTKYALPIAKTDAYTLRVVDQSKTNIQVEAISPKAEEIYVVAQNGGQIVFSEAVEAKAGKNVVSIPSTLFKVGITQITLFDNQRVPRSERLVFSNPHKQLNVSVKTDQEKYLPREKVKMTVSVTDESGKPVEGNFSLAVVDDKLLTFADDRQGHVLSAMLLESDLKGKIEEPNFYFDNESDPTRSKPEVSRARAMDNLMLTQGWRRFTWEQVNNSKYPTLTNVAEKGLVKGTAFDGQSKAMPEVRLVATHPVLGNFETKTDKNGQFVFDNLPLYETYTIKTVDAALMASAISISDFADTYSLYIYKKRDVKGVVKDNKGNAIKGIQVYNPVKGVYEATNDKGEFAMELYDMPQYNYIYIYDNQYKYQAQNLSLVNYDGKKVTVTLQDAYNYNQKRPNTTKSSSAKGNAGMRVHDAPVEHFGAAELDHVVVNENRVMAAPMQNAAIDVKELQFAPVRNAVVVDNKMAIGKKNNAEKANANGARPNAAPPVEEKKEEKVAKKEMSKAKDDLARDRAQNKVARKPMAPVVVAATRYHRAKQFYAPEYKEAANENTVRNDFRSTIYWNPTVRTNAKGIAELEFYNSDDLSQFRVTIEGFANNGGIGRAEYKYFTQQQFQLIAKVPTEVLTGDRLRLPLTLSNNSNKSISGKLNIELPSHIRWVTTPKMDVTLDAKASTTVFLDCEVLNKEGEGDFIVIFKSDKASDQMITNIKSRPRGFPVRQVFTGDKEAQKFTLDAIQPIEGSINVSVNIYPSVLDEILKGMESMLRMPSGCFEQTSSSNYPNLLVLQYMRESNMATPALEQQIMGYLATGYQRLTGYEAKKGGFHWWGYDPAHEGLTAYGLMQFVDMANVYSVDPKLIERTSKWLMSRRDNKGGWDLNPNCLHTWSKADVMNAYIVWALTEAKYGKDISKEIEEAYRNAEKTQDPYQMALVANALYNMNDARANKLTAELVKAQNKDGSFNGKSSSVTNSQGKALTGETTGLAVLAILKSKSNFAQAGKAIDYLKGAKDYYGYGSTQATVLTLKAIIEYTKQSKRTAEDGTIVVLVDGKEVARTAYKAGDKTITVPNLSAFIKSGKNQVEVRYEKTKSPIPFDVVFAYNTRIPQSSKDCKLALTTELASKEVKMGETVRITANLRNASNESVSMAMAQVGIPAGLSIQPWQLKEMQEKRLFDYYELFDGYVVLHFERMRANELKTISFDLKADIPGTYEAPASAAYLYYTHEHRTWVNPEAIVIQ